MSSCPPVERLRLLLSDQLGVIEELTLSAHVDTCVPCQQQLQQLTSSADLDRRGANGDAGPSGQTGELEKLVDGFEQAWQNWTPPPIEQFLAPCRADVGLADASARRQLLEELIKIDLEYRWRQVAGRRKRPDSLSSAAQRTTRTRVSTGGPGRGPRLEDYVGRYPELGSLQQLPVDLIAEEYRVRRQWGDGPGHTEYSTRFPDHDLEGLQQALLRIDAELDSEATRGAPGRQTRSPSADTRSWPEVMGYEIVGELGRGGMGVVYKARQSALNRLVALKMILQGAHAGADQLARFRREAEAIARLQHPHIVQIYDIGMQDGLPFFSMEFVAGGSLAAHLDGTPLPGRAAAALVETLARAVHAAHEQGIIHRDLKPANILLQGVLTAEDAEERGGGKPAGSPLRSSASSAVREFTPKISDFGLAKQLPDPALNGMPAADQTPSGAVLGTPSYMAPEQAQAKTAAVGLAVDVYSLGAIFYELLTGRPPFRAETTLETILQVLHQEPVPPRRLQPKLPRDLEIICLTCLRKEPQSRYASALALAEDLHRFLAGEPIHARPTGAVERGLKWARRRPALAALLTVSIAACLVLVIEDRRYQGQLVESLEVAKTEQRRADGNLRLARQAVDKTTTKLLEDPRLKQANFHQLRRDLFEYLVPFYQEFVDQQQNDPQLAAERGRAYLRLAFVRQEMGEQEQALREIEQMRAIFTRLADDFPEVPEYRQDLALSYFNRASLLRTMGRTKEAEEANREALALRKQLAAEYPDNPGYLQSLATSHRSLGNLLEFTGRPDLAADAHGEALAIYQRLVAEFPTVPEYRRELAAAHDSLGILLDNHSRPREAVSAFRDAVELRKELTAEFPRDPQHRRDLATSQNNLGSALQHTRQFQEAEEAYRAALALRKPLAADFPAVPDYRQDLATTHFDLGLLLAQTGRAAEAEAAHREALALRKQLVADFPGTPLYRQDLAASHRSLGATLQDAARPQEAEKAYREATTLLKALAADYPTSPMYRQELAKSYNFLAIVLQTTGRTSDAEGVYRDALAVQKQLAAEFPAVPDYRGELALSYYNLGGLLLNAARLEEAETAFRDALPLAKQLAAEFPSLPNYQQNLAGTMLYLAELSRRQKDFAAAREFLEQAAPHHQAALKANPSDPNYRLLFMNNRTLLALTLAALGDSAGTCRTAEQLAEVGWDPAADTYNGACILSQAIAVAEKDAALYTEQALAMLRQAIAKGYKDADHMKKDTDLDALRSQAEFKKLLLELEKK